MKTWRSEAKELLTKPGTEHRTFGPHSSLHQNTLLFSKTVEHLDVFLLFCNVPLGFSDQNIDSVRAAAKPLLAN